MLVHPRHCQSSHMWVAINGSISSEVDTFSGYADKNSFCFSDNSGDEAAGTAEVEGCEEVDGLGEVVTETVSSFGFRDSPIKFFNPLNSSSVYSLFPHRHCPLPSQHLLECHYLLLSLLPNGALPPHRTSKKKGAV